LEFFACWGDIFYSHITTVYIVILLLYNILLKNGCKLEVSQTIFYVLYVLLPSQQEVNCQFRFTVLFQILL